MNLAASGHRHLWPLAAKSLCFTNNLVDETNADANFSGFHDYEDFMGLEGSLGQGSDLSEKRRFSQGMEFAQTVTLLIESPPAKPAEAAPGSWDNGARANDAPTPQQAPVAKLRLQLPHMTNEASM